MKITDLDQIKFGSKDKIWRLDVSYNGINSLDLSGFKKLEVLSCGNTGIESLDKITFYNRDTIIELNVSDNKMTRLDVSRFKNLEGLFCSYNPIGSLDVSRNPKLYYLYCDSCNLSALNLSKNKKLEYLYCSDNLLTELNVSNCPELSDLICRNNSLAYVDLTKNPKLEDGFFGTGNYDGYPITVDENGKFDLKRIPGFKPENISNLEYNATPVALDGTVLQLPTGYFGTEYEFNYDYKCSDTITRQFSMKVNYSRVTVHLSPEGTDEKGITVKGNFSGMEKGVPKDIVVTIGKPFNGLATPVCEGYNFEGWYYWGISGMRRISAADIVEDTSIQYLYAQWSSINQELGAVIINEPSHDLVYNGTAIKPDIAVLDKNGNFISIDNYTVKYSNNVNANEYKKSEGSEEGKWTNPRKIPTITVTGKGNYTGTVKLYFEIRPLNIYEANLKGKITFNENIYAQYDNGKPQNPDPFVKYDGKALKKDVDYKLIVTRPDSEGRYQEAQFDEKGDYNIEIQGIGNYYGYLNSNGQIGIYKPVSKLNITVQAPKTFGVAEPQKITVKDGSKVLSGCQVKDAKEAKEASEVSGGEYQYVYYLVPNSESYGTVQIFFYGVIAKGYNGIAEKTYSLPKRKLAAKNIIVGSETMTFNPEHESTDPHKKLPDIEVKWESEPLKENTDYEINPNFNYKSGTVKFTVTGKGRYTGTVVKSFKLNPYVVEKVNEKDSPFTVEGLGESLAYSKNGARFDNIKVKYTSPKNTITLTEGVDYKVSYSNNSALNAKDSNGAWKNGNKIPKVKIDFKGNYKGFYEKEFQIEEKAISFDQNGAGADTVDIYAKDIVRGKNKGKYTTKMTVTEASSKKALKPGTDYTVKYYLGACGSIKDFAPAMANGNLVELKSDYALKDSDRDITVLVEGKGNYKGQSCYHYRACAGIMDNAKISLAPGVKKFYSGDVVDLKEDELVVKLGNKRLKYNEDYVFECDNNINSGTAVVRVTGIGEYGGRKEMKFAINKRKFTIPLFDNILGFL